MGIGKRIIPFYLGFSASRKQIAFRNYTLWEEREYYIAHPEALLAIFRDIAAFIERGLYGWSRHDACNLDLYLTSWLGDALAYIATRKPGLPYRYIDAAYAALGLDAAISDYTTPPTVLALAAELKAKEYADLASAFRGFNRVLTADPDRYTSARELEAARAAREGYRTLAEIFQNLWI